MAYPTVTQHSKVYPYTSIMAAPYSCDPTGSIDCVAAIEQIKANQSNVGRVFIPAGTFLINTDLTIPIDMTLDFAAGGKFSVASGKTLTILGPIKDDGQQIFTGSGTVVVSNTTTLKAHWYSTIALADAAAVALGLALEIDSGTYTISADTTLLSRIKVNKGVTFAIAITKTLTINDFEDPGDIQIFTLAGTGAVSFPYQGLIRSAWFGDGAASVQAAHDATTYGSCIIQLPRKKIDFGATTVTISKQGITLRGYGTSVENWAVVDPTNLWGTQIYGTASPLVKLGSTATSQGYVLKIEGIAFIGTKATPRVGKGIMVGSILDTYKAVGKVIIDNCAFVGLSDGISVRGVNWFRLTNSTLYGNSRGLVIPYITGADSVNVGEVEHNIFLSNLTYPVLMDWGTDWKFRFNTFGSNGYMFKVLAASGQSVDNLTLEHNWFEQDLQDAGHASGYFQVEIGAAGGGAVLSANLINNQFRGPLAATVSQDGLATGNGEFSLTAYKAEIRGNIYGYYGDSPSIVSHTGTAPYAQTQYYRCISKHTSGAASEPGTGANWRDYWQLTTDTTGAAAWVTATPYVQVYKPLNYVNVKALTLSNEDPEYFKFDSATRIQGGITGWGKSPYGGTTVTGTTTETLLLFESIPKNIVSVAETESFSASYKYGYDTGGVTNKWTVTTWGSKVGAAGNKTINLYMNGTVVGTIPAANNTNKWRIEAEVICTDITTGVGTFSVFTKVYDGTTVTPAITSVTANTTSPIPFVVSGLLANGGDSVIANCLSIEPGK